MALLISRGVMGADMSCAKAASPLEMSACVGARLETLLRRVSSLERFVMQGLRHLQPADDAKPPTGANAPVVRFEAAKTAWARYRDAECDAQAALYAQGTIEGLIRSVCQSNAVVARLRELKHAYRDVLRERAAAS